MSNPHHRRHKPRHARKGPKSGQEAAASAASTPKKEPPAGQGGKRPPRSRAGAGNRNSGRNTIKTPNKNRWFYDVRQYALLTDEKGNLLILQLPKEYDATAANTWTLPGGKLEPTDEPGEGLLREITEETGLPATLVGPCGVARWTSRNSKKLGIFYRATTQGEKPKLKLSREHQRAVWISPAEVQDFPFHREEMLDMVKKLNV